MNVVYVGSKEELCFAIYLFTLSKTLCFGTWWLYWLLADFPKDHQRAFVSLAGLKNSKTIHRKTEAWLLFPYFGTFWKAKFLPIRCSRTFS